MKIDWLQVLIFVAGFVLTGMQMAASRLLATRFGASLLTWAGLIASLMVFMALGYWLGGWLVSRYPNPRLLYRLIILSGLLIAFIPLLSTPLLDFTLNLLADTGGGQFWGTLISLSLLFAAPSILLSIINPFAVQLRLISAGSVGKTSGNIAALTTIGNLAGIFATVLFILPGIGIRNTLFLFALIVTACALPGWLLKPAYK